MAISSDQAVADPETDTGTDDNTAATVVEVAQGNDFTSRLDSAENPADILSLLDDVNSGGIEVPQGEAKEKPTDVIETEETEETEQLEETETNEGAAKLEEKEDEEPEGSDSAEKPEEDEDEDETEGDASAHRKQFRIRGSDAVEERALELKKFNRDMSLDECLERARRETSGSNTEDSKAEDTEEERADGLPSTTDATRLKIKELRTERSKAMTEELDLAKADRLDQEIDDLRDHLIVIDREEHGKASQKQSAETRLYDESFDAATAKAHGLYDFLKDSKSAAMVRLREIDATLKENGDPLFNDPDKPLKLAQMVASELRIAPKSKKTAAPSKEAKKSAPVESAQKVQLASGSSRTSTQSNGKDQLTQTLDSIKSPADLARAMEALGISIDTG